MEKVSIALRKVPVGIIKLYQTLLSPMLGPTCRFHPSCSHYAVDAITEHGMIRGCWISIKRILKCHPFNDGGYDPVPEKKE
ncbi:membrane protein insertion efficiency factor YidD [uncultured Paraglaciecola sp.]|jgi:putative membrane protein insertion efficiency factor|uniref:membrane protein insertion efficiency factor YidD n=1 Tax=uncultured Paraglaciecola sp. TaxID=1765024 RepID=UPI002626E931|nr:membrane protein insertion efficiency factor YidD [uncultured Paraglaciecola sp.]